jgi:hypothetical protein
MQFDLQELSQLMVGPLAPDPQVALSLLAMYGNQLHLPHVKCFCFSPISSFLKNIQPLSLFNFDAPYIKSRLLKRTKTTAQAHH